MLTFLRLEKHFKYIQSVFAHLNKILPWVLLKIILRRWSPPWNTSASSPPLRICAYSCYPKNADGFCSFLEEILLNLPVDIVLISFCSFNTENSFKWQKGKQIYRTWEMVKFWYQFTLPGNGIYFLWQSHYSSTSFLYGFISDTWN